MSATDPEVQIARLSERVAAHDAALGELRVDVKQILAAVNLTQVQVAVLPSWVAVKAMHDETRVMVQSLATEVETLKDLKNQAKGGWKVVTIIGLLAGTIGGWVVSLFPFHAK